MKFHIISINDQRNCYKDAIREYAGMDEFQLQAFDANIADPIKAASDRGLDLDKLYNVWGNPKKGELGIWLSNYDIWRAAKEFNETLVVFEDDAIIHQGFKDKLDLLVAELPSDWDFCALWVPDNQRRDYRYATEYENGIPRISGTRPDWESSQYDYGPERAAMVYQGYGMVSLMYSPTGGAKLEQLAKEYGLTGPVDCWIYEQAHRGNLNGYAPKPNYADLVYYDWAAESHVQLTGRVL